MAAARRAEWHSALARPRVVDAAVVLACLLLTALAVKTPWSTLPLPVVAAAGVLGSAAQWPRRRWPWLAVVAGAAAYALSGNPGPWLVGLYAGAAYAPRRQVWAYALAGWLGYAGRSWLDTGRLGLEDALFGALGVGLVVAVGVFLATRNALLDSLRERAARAETERRLREEQARAAERTRIAREMHDVLAHKVSLIALYAGALELHARGDTRLEQGTALIRATAREALRELRTVLGVLRPEPGDPSGYQALDGGYPDLDALVRASTRAGQPVELRDEVGPLPPATARVVYRIVQEGLTNAHKHAPGAQTTVAVSRDAAGGVIVTVHNAVRDTTAMDTPGSGSGLVGLAERIRLVGGSLRSGPSQRGDNGWELCATVPWLDPRPEDSPAEVEPS